MSATKTEANRKNAHLSTGPRTVSGKRRASRNARRHGLSIALGATREVKRFAAKLLNSVPGELHNTAIQNWALLIAEAQFDLERARTTKQAVYCELEVAHFSSDNAKRNASSSAELHSAMKKIRSIDRYEQRALSRWHKAVRYFRSHVKEQMKRARAVARVLRG